MQALAAAGAACSVKYLGRAGLQTLAGLNVAYMDGFFNPEKFREAPDEAGTGDGCRYFTQVSTRDEDCCADCCADAPFAVLQGDREGSATAQVPGMAAYSMLAPAAPLPDEHDDLFSHVVDILHRSWGSTAHCKSMRDVMAQPLFFSMLAGTHRPS